MSDEKLEKRQREVLAAVVRLYISKGVPVGSKAVAEQFEVELSSATIRSVMVSLETQGFLEQPHVSAGRVPTDKAYRFYVDRMVGTKRLGPATERYIDQKLGGDSPALDGLMEKASRVLSEISHSLGVVLGPALEEKLLEHIKFVKLPDQRILVVIVSRPDLVENKVLRLDEGFSQGELDRTANFLNSDFRGWSLRTIRLEIVRRMEAEVIVYDRLLKNVAALFMWGALGEESLAPLYVDDTSRILDRTEFKDTRKIRKLLGALKERAQLIKILSACLASSKSGVRLLIGRENPEKRMRQCAFVVAPFHYRNRAVGALGVIGPTRMEYERAINTVDYVAHLTTKLLNAN